MESLIYLKQDFLKNVGLIYFAEDHACTIEQFGRTVILRGASDRTWTYISCTDKNDLATAIIELEPSDKNFAAIEPWMRPALAQNKKILWELDCQRMYYPSKTLHHLYPCLPALKLSHAEYIFENSDYREIMTLSYVKDRITRGLSSCIEAGGYPVGWAMTQDDGSMGFLHVMPGNRQQGYALHLTLDLMQKVLDVGRIPFVQIEKKNAISINLAQKAGFIPDRDLCWFASE